MTKTRPRPPSHKLTTAISFAVFCSLSGCATIVNDAHIPVTFEFTDGSKGTCELSNKRGVWIQKLPGTAMIRRSDDELMYKCETADGRKSNGAISSEVEDGKFIASMAFFDFGITDAITDKHRKYSRSVKIPVELKK